MFKSRKFPWFSVIFLSCTIGVLTVPAYFFYNQWKTKQREDLMWMARGQLELMKGNKSVEFLRLWDISYSDNTLHLLFHSTYPYYKHDFTESSIVQDTMQLYFLKNHALLLAYARVSPESWDLACKYLKEADVNLRVTYQYLDTLVETEPLTPEVLGKLFSERNKTDGLKLYSNLKALETLAYAKRHFKRDIAFTADSIKVEDNFVALHLSYDDRYSIEHFLDTTHVNAHFTDDVGEMGSILDNMLEICVRTERGFAFVYTGTRKHKVDRLQWDYSRIGEYVDAKVIRGLRNDKRKFNSVHTVIIRDRKE